MLAEWSLRADRRQRLAAWPLDPGQTPILGIEALLQVRVLVLQHPNHASAQSAASDATG